MQAARAFTLLLAALLVTITTPGSAVAATGPACSDTRPLVFGFLPLVSPEKLVQRFVPLVNYLATQIGTEIRIETSPDFAEFARSCGGRGFTVQHAGELEPALREAIAVDDGPSLVEVRTAGKWV